MKKILFAMLAMVFILTSIVLAENETTNTTVNETQTNVTLNTTVNETDLNVTINETNTTLNETNTTTNTTTNVTTNTTTNNTVNNTNVTTNTTTNVTTNTTTNTTANTTTNNTNNNSVNNTDLDRYYKALEVRYEHLKCKVELTNKQIDLFDKYLPELNLDNYKTEIKKDLEQLKEYSEDKDKEAFNTYLEAEFKQDFIKATAALVNAKKEFRNYNLTNETKKDIINELKEYKSEYAECTSDKQLKMAKLTQKHFERLNEHWEKSLEKMSKRGLDTVELEKLREEIEDRDEKIQELIESKDYEALNAYLKELRKEHLHAAARFEIEELKSHNEKLKSEAKRYGVEKSFEDIDKNIEDAEKKAERGRKYEEKEMKETWKSIKEANKEMRETSKDILKERQKGKYKNYSDSEDNDSDDDSEDDSDEDDDSQEDD
jgi:hypothetical protein